MNIEEALFAHLTADAGVSGLIGARCYPDEAPQDAQHPLLVYERISTPRVYSQSGESGLASPRLQITCRAEAYSQVRELANKVRAALSGFKGTMGGEGGVSVGAVFVDNERDGGRGGGNEYNLAMDIIVWHEEA